MESEKPRHATAAPVALFKILESDGMVRTFMYWDTVDAAYALHRAWTSAFYSLLSFNRQADAFFDSK